jgi:hypothetical protein
MECVLFQSVNTDGTFMKFDMKKHRHHGWSLVASDGRYWNGGSKIGDGKWKFSRDVGIGNKELWEVELEGETVTNTVWHNTEPHGFDQWTPVARFCANLIKGQ